MNITRQEIAAIFNEWADRYSKNPDEFSEILGEDGKPVADYGEACAIYFAKLFGEMGTATP